MQMITTHAMHASTSYTPLSQGHPGMPMPSQYPHTKKYPTITLRYHREYLSPRLNRTVVDFLLENGVEMCEDKCTIGIVATELEGFRQ